MISRLTGREWDELFAIDLSEQTSVESREISEGVVLDYDARGNLVGIDIDNASTKAEIHKACREQASGFGGDHRELTGACTRPETTRAQF